MGVNVIDVVDGHKQNLVVGSRGENGELKRDLIRVGDDVVGNSNGSSCEKTRLDGRVGQFDREVGVASVPSPRDSDGRVSNPAGASGLPDAEGGASDEREGGEEGGKGEHYEDQTSTGRKSKDKIGRAHV